MCFAFVYVLFYYWNKTNTTIERVIRKHNLKNRSKGLRVKTVNVSTCLSFITSSYFMDNYERLLRKEKKETENNLLYNYL